jgi:two-component sensor histidine kinase
MEESRGRGKSVLAGKGTPYERNSSPGKKQPSTGLQLLNLEKESMFDSRDAAYLEDCRNRVHSMALVHENLYGSEHLDRISLQSYCEDLFSNLELTYRLNERGITLQRELQNLEMDLEVAVPLGLLITELVSNAAQHGFPEGGGSIIVRYREAEQKGWMLLEVKDTGVGFPEDFDPDTSRGLGLHWSILW